MNKVGIVIVLAGMILGCVAPAVNIQRSESQTCRSFNIDYSKVVMPEHLGGSSIVERTVLKEQNLGLLVRYSGPEANTSNIDVFVYPICLPKSCSLANMNELEMAKVVKEVQTVNTGAAIQELKSFIGERNGKRYEALKAKIAIPKDRQWLSFVYLAVINDVYLKIRFTQPGGKDHESQVDRLAASLLTELSFEDPQAHKHDIAPTLFLNSEETKPGKSHVLSALLSYSVFMCIEIENGRYLDTLDRLLNCWELTLKILEDKKSNRSLEAIDASFAGMIAVRNAGYLKEYLWTYFRKPYWIQPQGFRLGDFEVWASHNLKGHTPYDTSRVLVEWK